MHRETIYTLALFVKNQSMHLHINSTLGQNHETIITMLYTKHTTSMVSTAGALFPFKWNNTQDYKVIKTS